MKRTGKYIKSNLSLQAAEHKHGHMHINNAPKIYLHQHSSIHLIIRRFHHISPDLQEASADSWLSEVTLAVTGRLAVTLYYGLNEDV